MKILEKNRSYPEKARKSKTEGKIIISFTIDEKGKTANVISKTKEPKILSDYSEEFIKNIIFPLPPKHWNKASKIELPITYKLKK